MNKIKNVFKTFDKKILIILLVAILTVSPYVTGGYHLGHDSAYHISNLFSYLKGFNIFDLHLDKIIPIVAQDFGYGNGFFYPPLAYNIAAYVYEILHNFGFGLFMTIKVVYFLSILLSGLFMYILVKKVFKNDWAALLASILYMTFPYHILDIFTRDAMAESMMFMFVPLVFLGINYLLNENRKMFYLCFVAGYAGAILSHLVLSVYLTIFVILFLLFNYKIVFTKKNIISFCIAAIMILLFTSPFIIPLLEHKILGQYMVFEPYHMATCESVMSHTLTIDDLISLPDKGAYIYYTVSYVALIAFVVMLFCGYKKIDNKKWYIGFVVLLFICSIMICSLFPWNKMPTFLLNIQFPWRLELFLAFFMSILGSLVVLLAKKSNQKILTTILATVTVLFGIYFTHLYTYEPIDLKAIDVSTGGLGWGYEYLPVQTYENFDYFKKRSKDVVIIKGEASVTKVKSETPYLSFKIETDGATLELPRLYYLGYEITLNDGKKKVKLDYIENEMGFIQIDVPNSGVITLNYVGTNGYKISIFLYLMAVVISVSYFIVTTRKKEKFKKL